MIDFLIVLCATVLLVGVLFFEKKGATTPRAVLKGCVSLLFVVTALLQPHPVPAYCGRILAGLALGLIGDVCLAIPGNRSFRIGLFAFLAGHLLYVWAFSALAPLDSWLSPVQLIFIAFSLAAFVWLRPHVGRMRVPVIVYLVVITLMLAGAWAVLRSPGLGTAARGCVWAGALCFYLSDLFVARQRFVKAEFLNRLIGLPLYYTGQFMLAFSVGLAATINEDLIRMMQG